MLDVKHSAMHEFHRRVGIGKCLKFSYTYIKIAIEMLEKLKSRIENAGMYCSTRGFAPRCCNTCTHFQCLTLTFQVFVYCMYGCVYPLWMLGLCQHRPGHSLGKNTRSCTHAHTRIRTRSHTRAGTRGHTYAHARIIRTRAHTRKRVYGCV